MKIKRFTGSDMRQAIKYVRDALGADAVILSNQVTADGVEVVAAIDYDESLLGLADKENAATTFQKSEKDIQREAIWDDVRYGRGIKAAASQAAQTTSAQTNSTQTKSTQAQTNSVAGQQQTFRLNDDESFKDMQAEIKSLRGLLVNQLSGLAWENETRYHPIRARILQRLIALGLSPTLARSITEQLQENDDIDHNWRMALGILAHQLPVMDDSILNAKKNVIAIVGATGVGKTTTVAKLAARYLLRHGKG